MNYSEALSFVFRDEQWLKKLVIGGFIAMVSFYVGLFFILGFFLLGYYVCILRRVMAGEEDALPEWSDASKLFIDGILGAVIALVYTVIIGGLCALFIVQLVNSPYTSDAEVALGCVVISLLTILALTCVINYGLIQYAHTDNFGAAFSVAGMMLFFRHHLGDLIAITVFSFILNMILLVAGLGILSPFTNFWGMVVQAHLFGQCARRFVPEPPAAQAV